MDVGDGERDREPQSGPTPPIEAGEPLEGPVDLFRSEPRPVVLDLDPGLRARRLETKGDPGDGVTASVVEEVPDRVLERLETGTDQRLFRPLVADLESGSEGRGTWFPVVRAVSVTDVSGTALSDTV